MDSAYLIEIASMLLRWLHLIVGIAWIGSSFYFIWLDNTIRPPTDPKLKEAGVGGELWAMHAGGFYNPQKYLVAPKELPKDLHFFFWPSYSTWITGFLLISTLYYLQAATWMVDPAVANISSAQAVMIGLGTLAAGWIVYDLLARFLIERSQLLFALVYTLFVAAMAWALTHVLAGRAAYIHVGAMIATAMSANVFFIIIPGQRKLVAAMKRGEPADPVIGKKAKQRSVHNNYLTLPVLFAMISNHYAFTYGHPHAWLVLVLIMIGAALIRHFFNLRHKGQLRWEFPIAGGAILGAVLFWIAPTPVKVEASANAPTLAQIAPIVQTRCTGCHAEHSTLMPAAPAGMMLDTDARIRQHAQRIFARAVQTRDMPLGNITGITDDERKLLGAWYLGGTR
jgi:uncharacterized membrane protein